MSHGEQSPGATEPNRPGRERAFLPPGTRVGRYVVIETLGHGGMGVLYRVRDDRLGRSIALKCPWPDLADNERALRRFEREARSAARLTHPAIVRVYEVFEHAGLPWIAMEWVPGQNLRAALAVGRPSIDRILLWAEQLAAGLAHAHAHQVLHRDVNPSNVLIHDNGNALLVDFGLARRLPSKASPTPPGETETRADADPDAPQVSADGAIVGTPRYMSPEQALGNELDERSDVFSLGLVLYEACTGRPLLTGERVPEVFEQLESLDVPSIRAENADVPPELERIIGRALERDPLRRYASAGELRDELTQLRARRARPRAALKRAVTALLVLGVVLAAFVAVRMKQNAAPVREAIATSLITWPSLEREPRLSPDGNWLSFISDRGGQRRVWVHSLAGDLEYTLTAEGDWAMSHAWSEDSETVAVLVKRDEEIRLDLVPALSGPKRVTHDVGAGMRNLRLDRWVGSKIFLNGEGRLGVFDLETGERSVLIDLRDDGRYRSMFSVAPDGRRVAYVLAGDDDDFVVWTSDLDGGNPRRVSGSGHQVWAPRWVAGGKALVYTSTRSGQHDLWRADLRRGAEEKLTLSPNIEIAGDCAANEAMLIFEQDLDETHLWAVTPGGRPRQVTANARSDFLPAPAAGAALVAFQRANQRVQAGHPLLDTGIATAVWESGALGSSAARVDHGYAPELSSGGDWLAYVNGQKLTVRRLATGREFEATDRLRRVGLYPHPIGWVEAAFNWSPVAPDLFYAVIDTPEARLEVRSFESGGISPARSLVTVESPHWVEEIYPGPAGERIAYVLRAPGEYSLHVTETRGGDATRVAESDRALHPRGWLDGQRLLVLSETGSHRFDLDVVSLGGTVRTLASVERAFVATASYHPRRRGLTITLESPDGLHNIWSFSIDTGEATPVTDNTVPGITFQRARSLPDGTLIYARTETQSDIWAIEFGRTEES